MPKESHAPKCNPPSPPERIGRGGYYRNSTPREHATPLSVKRFSHRTTIRRLVTAMYDDHVDYYRATAANINMDPRPRRTSRLPGFTGSLFPGEREGRDPARREGVPPPPWLAGALHLTTIPVEFEEGEEDEIQDMSAATRSQYDANGLAREAEFDDDVVVALMENLSTGDD
ncbi:hypothetical protein DFH06DRAFT_1293587 [Mycena polygramma]|nr:hypothetical protein DFH06DRAFT_1293587 [Mycena polygramma]